MLVYWKAIVFTESFLGKWSSRPPATRPLHLNSAGTFVAATGPPNSQAETASSQQMALPRAVVFMETNVTHRIHVIFAFIYHTNHSNVGYTGILMGRVDGARTKICFEIWGVASKSLPILKGFKYSQLCSSLHSMHQLDMETNLS